MPETPGLGFEDLNEAMIREHIDPVTLVTLSRRMNGIRSGRTTVSGVR